METCFNYIYEKGRNDGIAYFSSDEQRWITKIHKLKASHPDDVEIIREPEDNDGCIYCKLPQKWLKVSAPKAVSEEQKERLKQIASKRTVHSQVKEQEAAFPTWDEYFPI